MTDTTPAQAATPEPQAGDGQQEPSQPDTGQQAPERTAAEFLEEIKALRAENAKWRKQYQDAQKATAAAAALQERLDAVLAQAQEANARRVAAIPEAMRGLVPDYDDPLKLANWLDANAAVFAKTPAPSLDGRAGGGQPAAALASDEQVQAFAARMGIDPAHVDRAQLAKAYQR